MFVGFEFWRNLCLRKILHLFHVFGRTGDVLKGCSVLAMFALKTGKEIFPAVTWHSTLPWSL